MVKKILAATIIFGAFTATSHAGGGGASWQPNVEPINCVLGGSNFTWNNKQDCNDVISNGYAKGVQYTGVFLYNDGSKQRFDALINPNNSYTPSHPAGKKVTGLSDTNWSWLR